MISFIVRTPFGFFFAYIVIGFGFLCNYAILTVEGETARLFRALSEEEKRHARDLAAAIYLITGKPYCPRVCVERPDMGDLCALLRALYHGEACAGYNYARAGEETLDLCLGKLFQAMSADEYRHAETLLKLLGRKMNI